MTTKEVSDYIIKNKNKVIQEFRLTFHAMPQIGWMNDPNGLVYYKGKYHIFYQHHPYDSVWGPMYWGHMVSKDLITFEHLPIALAPDQPDETGCFSGGAIIDVNDSDVLHLFYTKHYEGHDGTKETQALASSRDGLHFKKREQPIITAEMVEDYAKTNDVRDPSPFYQNGYYYIFVGAQGYDNHGRFLIFRSQNLEHFEYYDQWTNPTLFGKMGECPDVSILDGKHLFVYSIIEEDPKPGQPNNSCHYIIGDMDLERKRYTTERVESLDSGHHFYAPQTMKDPSGRTILIAWMDMWGDQTVTHNLNHHWQGALSIPRVLKIRNGQLLQRPIDELTRYRCQPKPLIDGMMIPKHIDMDLNLTKIPFNLSFTNPENKAEHFDVLYDGQKLHVDGTTLTINPLMKKSSRQTYREVALRILIDASSIEIFVNDGVETFTSRVYMRATNYIVRIDGNLSGMAYTIGKEPL